jgi:hypothetical protein
MRLLVSPQARREEILHAYQERSSLRGLTRTFSKSVVMHEACLLLFLHRYNPERAILLKGATTEKLISYCA